MDALYRLTFEGNDGSEITWRATLREWDGWYDRHKHESRQQWAERQILGDRPGAWLAADYLRRMNDRRVLLDLRRAASSTAANVRIIAARGITRFERAEGIALLERELEHRAPQVCADALAALNELTDHHHAFDFHVPAERAQAIAAYAQILQ